MSQKSSLHRTIEILKMLNDGKVLFVSRLAIMFEVSERTIRRDFQLIKEIFGDFITKQGQSYQAYQSFLLEDILNTTNLMTLANIINLLGVTNKKTEVSDKTKALLNSSQTVYDFKSRPFEDLANEKVIKKLEHAITYNKEIEMSYKVERNISIQIFLPYKIIFLNENFYVVVVNKENAQVQLRRIALILEINYTKNTFSKSKNVENFINEIQTPWSIFGKQKQIVKIRVKKKIRRFFTLKKYLPSQEVINTFENGDIEVHYQVTGFFEIKDLLIRWLPQVEILEPISYKRMIKRDLKHKLTGL